MTPLGFGLFLGLALRAGFFLAASLDLFFATVLRFVLRFFLVTAAGFFFAFEADFFARFPSHRQPPSYAGLQA